MRQEKNIFWVTEYKRSTPWLSYIQGKNDKGQASMTTLAPAEEESFEKARRAGKGWELARGNTVFALPDTTDW